MPALSFSCKPDDRIYLEQVLPALLDRAKTQTVRPLRFYWKPKLAKELLKPIYIKPRLEVGDIVTMYWKQRGTPKGSWFHKEDGTLYEGVLPPEVYPDTLQSVLFPKKLGQAKITEVFEIEMGTTDNLHAGPYKHEFYVRFMWGKEKGGVHTSTPVLQEFAKNDGFKNINEMFKWFDKKYDLSRPKRFAVFRWRWL